ncbi:fatty acid desaturase-domain-containing protein [Pseudomassariella vexata]|uniref:Fatty acid desaturase-domain-containing protein n=1 Tax=Pseudomassariella vexata TaxID=1141098 RepID=A0A1Y2E2H0_9PEZI|nr:fatty acid desaturase-domain-containing protein [Pseudomassariella vexata]ORY65516.1 fatty acid desaturase-domain-containing protein [Pseudomassariella vexata]
MAADYTTETIHADRVNGGEIEVDVDGEKNRLDIQQLRNRIPAHCFQPSTIRSLVFVFNDAVIFVALLATALSLENRVDRITGLLIRYVVYPFLAGLPLTGLWVLAHECGHGAFSRNKTIASSVGFVLHSALMSPYFAWQSSHARHHQYANHMTKDLNYVPPLRQEYSELFRSKIHLDDMIEDAPVVVLLRIVIQQVIGWPWYLLTHITAAPESSPKKSRGWWDNNHFDPMSSLFRPNEFWNIVASDVGLVSVGILLYFLGQLYGSSKLAWTYVMPTVMITYLHHTSPKLPKYSPGSWTYLRGALATVDRDPGFLLRHSFHHIIDLHVTHHLFPRIPHYHAQEATEAIRPLLGDHYHVDKGSYWRALWVAFTQCQWVEPDPTRTAQARVFKDSDDDKGVLWYRPGPMPKPATMMRS